MRIGELAEQAGISAKAIRYYEQIGILAPPARTPSGYRAYDQAALGRLGFVRAADLDARITELQQLRGELDRLAERASRLDPEHCPPERVCHLIG
jgi:MerR family transcriptional regulator, copper efflux regulator